MLETPSVTAVAKLSDAIGTAIGPNDSLIVTFADRVEVYGDVSSMSSKQAYSYRTIAPTVFGYSEQFRQEAKTIPHQLTTAAKVHVHSGRFVAIANDNTLMSWPAVRKATLETAHKIPITLPQGAQQIKHVFTSEALPEDVILVTDNGSVGACSFLSQVKSSEAGSTVRPITMKWQRNENESAVVGVDLVHARARTKSVTTQKPILTMMLASLSNETSSLEYQYLLFDFIPDPSTSTNPSTIARCMRKLAVPMPASVKDNSVVMLAAASGCTLSTSKPRVPIVYVSTFWSDARWDLFTVPSLAGFQSLVPVHSRQLLFASGNLPSTAALCFTAPRHVVLTAIAHPSAPASSASRHPSLPATSPFQKQVQAVVASNMAASLASPSIPSAASRAFEQGEAHALNTFTLVMDVAHGFAAAAQLNLQANFDITHAFNEAVRPKESTKSKRNAASDKTTSHLLHPYQRAKQIFLSPTTELTSLVPEDDPTMTTSQNKSMNAGFVVACPSQALHYSVELSEPTLMGAVLRSKASADYMCATPAAQVDAAYTALSGRTDDFDAWKFVQNLTTKQELTNEQTAEAKSEGSGTANPAPEAFKLLQMLPLQPAPKLVAMPSLPNVSVPSKSAKDQHTGKGSSKKIADKEQSQAVNGSDTDATITFWKDIFERWASFVASSDESERKAIVSMFPITAGVFGVELPTAPSAVPEQPPSKKASTKKTKAGAKKDKEAKSQPPFAVSPTEFLRHFMAYATAAAVPFDPSQSHSEVNISYVNDMKVWQALISAVKTRGRRYRRIPVFGRALFDGTTATALSPDTTKGSTDSVSDTESKEELSMEQFEAMSLRKRREMFGETRYPGTKRVQTEATGGEAVVEKSTFANVRMFSPLFVAVTAKHCAEQLQAAILAARSQFPDLTNSQLIEKLSGRDVSDYPFDDRLLLLLPLKVLLASHSLSARHVPGLLSILAQLGQWSMIEDSLYLIHDLGEADVVTLLQTVVDEWASQLKAHSAATVAEANSRYIEAHGNVLTMEKKEVTTGPEGVSKELLSAVLPVSLSVERARSLLLRILDAPASQAFLKPELRALDSTILICLLRLLLGWMQILWFYNSDGVTKRFRVYRSELVALGAKSGFVDLQSLSSDVSNPVKTFANTIKLTKITAVDGEDGAGEGTQSSSTGIPWYLQLLSTATGIVPISATTVPELHKVLDWTCALIDANFAQIVLLMNASVSNSVSISTPGVPSKRKINEAREMRDVITQMISIVSDHHLKFCKQAHSLKSFLNYFMQQQENPTKPVTVVPPYSIQSLNI